jgi:UDP-N-acetylmuramate--alanine ligase
MLMGLERLHFVGIGGAGMSPLAEVFAGMGFKVTGSDLLASGVTSRLAKLGIKVRIGHSAGNLGRCQAVVYSPAVALSNPELTAAQRRGLPLVPRTVLLNRLMRSTTGIGVAGTHGKTTVASMISMILIAGRLDPTVVLGGVLPGKGSGARVGRGRYLVAEACEYMESFLNLDPVIAVVTNVEREHMEYFKTEGRLHDAFASFIGRLPFYGKAVLSMDDPVLRRLGRQLKGQTLVGYAIARDAKYRVHELELAATGSSFLVLRSGKNLGRISLGVPGKHNVSNAMAAISVAMELGVKFSVLRSCLAKFRNAERRFELRQVGKLTLLDDYAHHPTEVTATLRTARRACRGRLLVIFQPHLYSRTRLMAREFVESLALADEVIICEVFKSREKRRAGGGEMLVRQAKRRLSARQAGKFSYQRDMSRAGRCLSSKAKDGDWIVTMGAGNIWRVRDEIVAELSG